MEEAKPTENGRAFFEALKRVWYPPSAKSRNHSTKHAKTYDELMERLRQDPSLSFLDTSLYPGFHPVVNAAAPSREALRNSFYLCNSLIQLMEKVFIDLNLQAETEQNHPHNAGWIKLFQQWVQSPFFRAAWKISSKTYGESFRKFCQQKLGLPLRED